MRPSRLKPGMAVVLTTSSGNKHAATVIQRTATNWGQKPCTLLHVPAFADAQDPDGRCQLTDYEVSRKLSLRIA